MSRQQQALVEREDQPQAAGPQDQMAATVRALAENPNVDVDKLERIIMLQQRMIDEQARHAFNVAFSSAQSEMRPVIEDANNPQTRSRYASYEALDRALRPIYTRHGFALTFGTAESPVAEHVRVVCEAIHRDGYAKPYFVDMPADGKGAKGGDVMTKTHAVGSALSYGQRYLLKMIWNVATAEKDDDGNKASGYQEPDHPAGYQDWLDDLVVTAESGLDALQDAWKGSKNEYRKFLTKHASGEWEALKRKAAKAGKEPPL